jgi:hypothetical protein
VVLAQRHNTNKWKRIMNPEIDAHLCSKIIFNKGAKSIQWREGQQMVLGN